MKNVDLLLVPTRRNPKGKDSLTDDVCDNCVFEESNYIILHLVELKIRDDLILYSETLIISQVNSSEFSMKTSLQNSTFYCIFNECQPYSKFISRLRYIVNMKQGAHTTKKENVIQNLLALPVIIQHSNVHKFVHTFPKKKKLSNKT